MLVLLAITGCSDLGDNDISSLYQDNNYYGSNSLNGSGSASFYGTVNGKDNISIIGTSNAFEVAGFPSDDILRFLDGAKLLDGSPSSNTIDNVMRDLIPYSVGEDHGKRKVLNIYAHTMEFTVICRDGSTPRVVVYFESCENPYDNNFVQYIEAASGCYWLYNFTIRSVKMTIDGSPVEKFEGMDYYFRIFYSPDSNNRSAR